MGKFIDLTGERFGDVCVLRRNGSISNKPAWECACSCGRVFITRASDLRMGKVQTCGCTRIAKSVAARKTHGLTNSPTYITWLNMVQRTTNPNHPRHKDYAGRGVTICDRWRASFQAFLEDMGERPDGMSLDRIDNDAGYFPENCRWATPHEQAANQRRSYRPRDPETGRWAK